MELTELKERLQQNRPKSTVTLELPDDVIADLKQVAAHLGFSDYRALIRAYVGQGLRIHLAGQEEQHKK